MPTSRLVIGLFLLLSSSAYAQDDVSIDDLIDSPKNVVDGTKKNDPVKDLKEKEAQAKEVSKENVESKNEEVSTEIKTKKTEKTITKDQTKVDFSAVDIEGKVQTPENMFLQGDIKQDLSQMIKLRQNFRNQLKNSGAAVRALVK